MTMADRWLLPDGIDEVLPPQAARVEFLRRALLDLYYRWGYELVVPPPVEFLDSLLTGVGGDLELQTFKLTDPLSGRTLGISADATPQIARMDAHSLHGAGPSRLCYCVNALRSTADQYQGGRNPMQVGLEVYGHSGIDADLEIVRLALESLHIAGAKDVHFAFGHIGIYRVLIEQAQLKTSDERALFEAIERKAYSEIDELLAQSGIDPDVAAILSRLPHLHGDINVLQEARDTFPNLPDEISRQLDQLAYLAQRINDEYPQVTLYFDLAELRGYEYHTGIVFAAYVSGYGQALAKGGRYDYTGKDFGRSRPATGCTLELKMLASLEEKASVKPAIWVPEPAGNAALDSAVKALRDQGERVIQLLPGQTTGPQDHQCDRQLIQKEGHWHVEPLA